MKFAVRVAFFLLLLVVVSEFWFRTVTPAAEIPISYIDSSTQIDRFDPNGPEQGICTVGRLAERAGEWRVNNAGWISSIDYFPASERQRPMIAILGDSYLEGFLSDVQMHIDPELEVALGQKYDVYAFAKSGWYLEQYVALARYATHEYEPSVIVVFVNGEDVSSSLRENGIRSTKWYQLGSTNGGFTEIPPSETQSGHARLKQAMHHSSTARYLVFNAKVRLPWETQPGVEDVNAQGERHAASAQAPGVSGSPEMRAQQLMPAASFMVGLIREQNPGVPMVFVGDGPRYLSSEELGNPISDPDVAAIEMASDRIQGCYFLDLRPVFSADWKKNHTRFESVDGHHWSPYGNRVVAEALASFLTSKGLVD